MQAERPRSVRAIAAIGLAIVVAVLWWGVERRRPPDRRADATRRVETQAPPDAPQAAPPRTEGGGAPNAAASDEPALPDTPWASVDLDKVREAMPDNLFWKMAMPTTDEAVIRERQEERTRWNVEYGKVLSNTATAEEIDAYYALQQRLASDYVEFGTYVLAEFGDKLPIRDIGLLKVAVELNMAKLEEIPRRIAEAQERRVAHDAARRAWREEQKAFQEDDSR